jgi:peptidoglycan LD-endopeptidase LytH
MKFARTVFTPVVLCASLALTAVLGAAERPTARADQAKSISAAKPIARPRAQLIVPVLGVAVGDLSDTWGAARGDGRSHKGIDIMAAQGEPVLAAADGRIVRFWTSELGGVSIYQSDESGRLIFYYAHLGARAEGLSEGDAVRQGDVIGFVGATGNATTPHLHFEISRVADARRWWRGQATNPYPHLVSGQAPE